MQKKGFTVVEVAVVMAIMAILLTIGVVSYRGSQSNGRDRERTADVTAIATHLESLYPQVIREGSTVIKPAGSYPSRSAFDTETRWNMMLDGLPRRALFAPGNSTTTPSFAINTNSVVETGITTTTVTPSATATSYIYAPQLAVDGNACHEITQECRAFKIFYRTEQGEYKIVESKRK